MKKLRRHPQRQNLILDSLPRTTRPFLLRRLSVGVRSLPLESIGGSRQTAREIFQLWKAIEQDAPRKPAALHSRGFPRTAPGFRLAPRTLRATFRAVHTPVDVQLIGREIAIRWDDGAESFHNHEELRAASPSASNQGERDILGNRYGGDGAKSFPGVTVTGWERVGNYALRFDFSDGHRTGLYAFDYLRRLGGLT